MKKPKMEECEIVDMYWLSPPWGCDKDTKILKIRCVRRGKTLFVPKRKNMWHYGELFETKQAAVNNMLKNVRDEIASCEEDQKLTKSNLKYVQRVVDTLK